MNKIIIMFQTSSETSCCWSFLTNLHENKMKMNYEEAPYNLLVTM